MTLFRALLGDLLASTLRFALRILCLGIGMSVLLSPLLPTALDLWQLIHDIVTFSA